jgi:hypothetical protein
MRKPTSATALSAAATRAVHEFGERDEDNLDYSEDGEGGDIAEQVIVSLVRCLSDSGPAGVHLLRKLTSAFEGMGDAVMERDHEGLEDAADAAHQALSKLLED